MGGFASRALCLTSFAVQLLQLHVPPLWLPRPKPSQLSQPSCGIVCWISLLKGTATPMPGERVRFPKGCNFEKSENGGPHEFQSVRSKCLICRVQL